MAAAQDSSAPVLPATIPRHSSAVTSARPSKAMSSACPPIIAATASASSTLAAAPAGPRSSRTWWPSVTSASPTSTAGPTPYSAHTVGR
jgi:hypothetical protein